MPQTRGLAWPLCFTARFPASLPAAAGLNPPADAPPVDYSVLGSPTYITFGVFSALGTIAFGFGDTILPEVQVRLARASLGLLAAPLPSMRVPAMQRRGLRAGSGSPVLTSQPPRLGSLDACRPRLGSP